MKSIVYLIEFSRRKLLNKMPYRYIGSKSNCYYKDNKLLDKNNNEYFGSSSVKDYRDICLEEKEFVKVNVLGEFNNYKDCLEFEKEMHIINDVVANPEFFNKSVATISTYANPNYGTYRHSIYDKYVRLPIDHLLVLDGTYVNSNKGYKTYNNGFEEKQFLYDPGQDWLLGRLEKNRGLGDKNSFFGKNHTKETKKKITDKRKKYYDENPDEYLKVKEKLSETATKTFKGIPKTAISNLKRGRKNMIMLKNVLTGETIRVFKDKKANYDEDTWKNPYKILRSNKEKGDTKWCTDGKKNIKLKIDEELPENFNYGRTVRCCEIKFKWYNNGIRNFKIEEKLEIPPGHNPGMIKRIRNETEIN